MSDDELDGLDRTLGRRLRSAARLATSAGRLATRRWVGAEGDQDRRLGEALARELDEMKGMAMKVGQILSYFDGVLPDSAHVALQRLQQGTRPVAFERMAAVIEQAFGRPHDQVFEGLEPTAVAAASIGQVHRARFAGVDVAVKIQYPGIRSTMASDFARLQRIAGLASLASAVDGRALVDELQDRFLEECDYLREAAFQRAFRRRFAHDPSVIIPEVFAAATRATVLTTRWHEGRGFHGFVASSDTSAKNAAAMTIASFAHRCLFAIGTLNADPHPGNYLFPGAKEVVFLDFGCVKRFEPDYLAAERRVARAAVEGRRIDFRAALIDTGLVADPDRFDFDHHWQWVCHLYAPYHPPRFRFTREYVRRGMEFGRPSNPNVRRLRIPPPWIWIQRLYWGLHAVLARMEAEGDFASGFREALDTDPEPLEVVA